MSEMAFDVKLNVLTEQPECGIPMRVSVVVSHSKRDRLVVCLSLPESNPCKFNYAGKPKEYCRKRTAGNVTESTFGFRPTVSCEKRGFIRLRLTATATNQSGQSGSDIRVVTIEC